jgi:catechol 2,3-dioxygenase-like lactoylglutathione lyase family enzyme
MQRLIPMLPVRSMPSSVDWYGKLGFTVENRNDGWGWAMLRFDEFRLDDPDGNRLWIGQDLSAKRQER